MFNEETSLLVTIKIYNTITVNYENPKLSIFVSKELTIPTSRANVSAIL